MRSSPIARGRVGGACASASLGSAEDGSAAGRSEARVSPAGGPGEDGEILRDQREEVEAGELEADAPSAEPGSAAADRPARELSGRC